MLRRLADVDLRALKDGELGEALDNYDALWVQLGLRLDAERLGAARRCRLIATPTTGLDHIDLTACKAASIRVVSLQGESAFLRDVRATAEHTIGLMLALLRHLPRAVTSVEAGAWDRNRFRGRELFGKTVGLVGVGRLGLLVARYLTAFDARVIGYDPHAELPPDMERAGSLRALLAEADIVSLHTTYNASTHRLIGPAELKAMRPGAVLVNTARGGIIDDGALLVALEQGHLAGAALDVLEGEPAIDASHPLVTYARTHDNLVLTPHLGGNTYESFEKTQVFLAEKVCAALETQP